MKYIFTVLVIASLSGCAGIIKGNNANITVNSLERGTTIFVDGAPRGIDVAMVNAKKGTPHILRVEKENCQSVVAETGESFDFTTLLGVFIDYGIISIPVDFISGAAWKVDPTTYTLTPLCSNKIVNTQPLQLENGTSKASATNNNNNNKLLIN